MNKKGDIWISAVIYIALGIVILTLVLAAGLPIINKLKDTYTARQTKELMLTLDNNIRSVYNQGPGAQTQVKLRIGDGEFLIDSSGNRITWETRTKAILSEPDIEVQEGNLKILTESSVQKGEYNLYLTLEYTQLNITSTEIALKGTNLIAVTNIGNGGVRLTKL